MSGTVIEELPLPPTFRRKDKLRLSLIRSISEPNDDPKSRVRSIDVNEMARRLNSNSNKNRLPFLLLDCRGYLCYSDCHIKGAVHIACTDRFNRKRVQNGSVLELVSNNNRRNRCNGFNNNGKYREIIVYDEGSTDLNLDTWSSPISFVLLHLLQENRHPLYLNGGIKEFTRYYRDLTDTCSNNSSAKKDLNIMSSTDSNDSSSSTFPFLTSPLSPTNKGSISSPSCMDSYENEPPTQILPFLYIGNARDAIDKELLRKLRISYILSVINNNGRWSSCPANENSNTNQSVITNKDDGEFRTKLIPVSDNLCENLAPYFDEACDFIDEARKSGTSILIHCHAGISRSPTFAIAYIMKHINLSTLEAYAFVQRYRRIISPNLNFMGQLVEFESKLKSASSDGSLSGSTSSSSSSDGNSSLVSSTELSISSSIEAPMMIM